MVATRWLAMLVAVVIAACAAPGGDGGDRVVRTDHQVRVVSTAPSMAGREVQIYVREVASATMPRAPVVLFVHGAGTPAEVAFDVPYKDYSWMAYLARGGFDVFSMDLTGYGRTTRPPPMSDMCNLSKEQQAQFIPKYIAAPCNPTVSTAMTTMASDWDDIGAVVDHLRKLRGVDRVSLVGWSQGGPRAGGYAVRHPDKVDRLVVLAPAYNGDGPLDAPNPIPPGPGPMTTQSATNFTSNWDRQVGCADQYEPGTSASVWSEMLASDPVGARWEPAVRRAPPLPTGGPPALRRCRLEAEGVRRPGVLVAQRDVGTQPPDAVQGVARLAQRRQGQRAVGGRSEVGVLISTGTCPAVIDFALLSGTRVREPCP